MNFDELLIREQLVLLRKFLYHIHFYRRLNSEPALKTTHVHFWQFTIDAHILEATLNWCMVFGSDKNNDTHWKKVVICGHRRESFRKQVLLVTDFTWEDWKRYWTQIVKFRNEYAAHWGRYRGKVPKFEKAIAVAYGYDEWLRNVIKPNNLHFPKLAHWEEQAQIAVESFLNGLLRKRKQN